MQYGIGTYIRELTKALLEIYKIRIILVSYRSSESREVTFRMESERYTQVLIPAPLSYSANIKNAEKKYASAIVKILSQIIHDMGEVVFQMNYIDDLYIAKILKEKYEHPVISVVHFAQFQKVLNGDKNKLEGLNLQNPSNSIEFTLSSEKEFYEVSDHVISVTGYMKDFLSNYYKIDTYKISVIPNGLKILDFEIVSNLEKLRIKQELGFGIDDIICLFSGRIDSCKGVGFLLSAFEIASKKSNNLKLVMLGQGDLQEIQANVDSAYGKIIYTGFLPEGKVKLFYKIADIGLVPSVYDHCPYAALEMIASRLPLIMARIDGLNEILDDSECLFIDPLLDDNYTITYNINVLSELILKLAMDRVLRHKQSDEAYRKINKRNTSAIMAASMFGIFQNLLKHKLIVQV